MFTETSPFPTPSPACRATLFCGAGRSRGDGEDTPDKPLSLFCRLSYGLLSNAGTGNYFNQTQMAYVLTPPTFILVENPSLSAFSKTLLAEAAEVARLIFPRQSEMIREPPYVGCYFFNSVLSVNIV